ncbi:DUF6266 family protein [Pararcticibacter amylolyticus]|uniref:Uncharacterized protein n=1 Tax=Pararcticibacter amylolyticus TaxID=2173175 RepID=A0A2U2PKS5_9SPHI|nr:DUF6266 family protein [Pararcticibacter amylolyticus]PWG81928.1 hypothetical protein DDR33_02530 [Pararcticibacter amylolyticus]
MGEIKKGANGGFSGKAGSVIGSKWRSISYIRGLSEKSNKPATTAQLEQRLRFALMTSFLAPLKDLLEKSYSSRDMTRATGYNLSLRDNLNEAIKGTYPDFEIDFSKVVISRGALIGLAGEKFISEVPDVVDISWNSFSNGLAGFATDSVYIVLYNTTRKFHVLSVGQAKREDGTIQITMPQGFSGDTIEGLLFFVSEDGRYSRSGYLGQTTMF